MNDKKGIITKIENATRTDWNSTVQKQYSFKAVYIKADDGQKLELDANFQPNNIQVGDRVNIHYQRQNWVITSVLKESFKQFLNEEPELSSVHQKMFQSLGKKFEYHLKHTDIFPKGQDRIYLPVSGSFTASLDSNFKDRLKKMVKREKDFIKQEFYKKNIFNVKINSAINLNKDSISFTIKHNNLKEKKLVPIEDIIKKHAANPSNEKLYLGIWKNNAFRKGPKFGKLNIVISRHPEDVGGMSTNVGWKSCMNLYNGCYNSYTKKDVEHGTLVVYFIDANDKDIKYPIGRTLIKSYLSADKTDKYLGYPDKIYGEFPPNAINVLENWLDKIQKDKTGSFEKNPKLYDDNERNFIQAGKQKKFKVGDKVKVILAHNKKWLIGKVGRVVSINDYTESIEYEVSFNNRPTEYFESPQLEKV